MSDKFQFQSMGDINTKMPKEQYESNRKKIDVAVQKYLDKTTDLETFKKNVSEFILEEFKAAGEVPPPFEVEIQGIGLFVKFPDKSEMS